MILGLGGGLVKMPEDCRPNTQTLGSDVTIYHMVESLEKVRSLIPKVETDLSLTWNQTRLKLTSMNWVVRRSCQRPPQADSDFYINATDLEGNRFGIYQLARGSDS